MEDCSANVKVSCEVRLRYQPFATRKGKREREAIFAQPFDFLQTKAHATLIAALILTPHI